MDKKINKYVFLFNVIWFSIVNFTFLYLREKYGLNFWLTVILIVTLDVLGINLFRKVTKIYY